MSDDVLASASRSRDVAGGSYGPPEEPSPGGVPWHLDDCRDLVVAGIRTEEAQGRASATGRSCLGNARRRRARRAGALRGNSQQSLE